MDSYQKRITVTPRDDVPICVPITMNDAVARPGKGEDKRKTLYGLI